VGLRQLLSSTSSLVERADHILEIVKREIVAIGGRFANRPGETAPGEQRIFDRGGIAA